MGTRVGMLGVLAIAAVISASGQPYQRGEVLSTEFLTSLVQERLSPWQVAVINVPASSAMIFERDPSDAPITVLGGSTFLWAQIARQLSHSVSRNEPMHLIVKRWFIPAAACPAAADHIREFLARLAEVGKVRVGGSSDSALQEVVVDGPAFRIVTKDRDAWVTIAPYAPLNPPLHQAAEQLTSVVSGCTNSISPSIEQHDF